jgi:hypothetical protein
MCESTLLQVGFSRKLTPITSSVKIYEGIFSKKEQRLGNWSAMQAFSDEAKIAKGIF